MSARKGALGLGSLYLKFLVVTVTWEVSMMCIVVTCHWCGASWDSWMLRSECCYRCGTPVTDQQLAEIRIADEEGFAGLLGGVTAAKRTTAPRVDLSVIFLLIALVALAAAMVLPRIQ